MDSRYYEEIGKAVKRAKKNGGDLTTQNLLYVIKIAIDVANKTGVDENDLIAIGAEAMKEIEEKYDKTKNDNFIKACGPSIRGKMLNFVNRQTHLVHIPVNHLKGFKKGQDSKEETKISYNDIDMYDYDTLGECSNYAFRNEEDIVLRKGIKTLDEAGQKTIKIKLKLDEYSNLEKNNYQVMAQQLEVPIHVARKIYNESFEKLSKYCQKAVN